MRPKDFVMKMAGVGDKDFAAPGAGSSPSGYVYSLSYSIAFNNLYGFPPGQDGVWFLQVAYKFGGGPMVFQADVEFEEKGVKRTGWIYQCNNVIPGGPSDLLLFFSNYELNGSYFLTVTTLPYTPGQPPTGLDDAVPCNRWPDDSAG